MKFLNYFTGTFILCLLFSLKIEAQPCPVLSAVTSQTVCAEQNVDAINFISSEPNTTINWTNNNIGIGLAANGTGNINSFIATNTSSSPLTAIITATPTANGCDGSPQTFTITVNNQILPDFTQVPSICEGGTLNPLPTTSDNGINGSWAPSINNLQTTTYTFTPNVVSCVNNYQMTISVNPIPVLASISSQTVCAGENLSSIIFSSNVSGTSVNWTNSEPSIGLPSSGTGDIASFTGTNGGSSPLTATITATPTANGCFGSPQTFSVTVNPIPVLSIVASQTVCAGQAVNGVTFTSSVSGSTIDWTNTDATIGLSATGNGNINSFTGSNTGTAPIIATISAIPTASGCDGAAQTFSITVNPLPQLNTIPSQTVCAGHTVNGVTFTSSVSGSIINWTNTETAIGLAASGNTNISSFTGTNNGSSPLTAIIVATPTANGCDGSPQTFSITVNPNITPVFDPINPICDGQGNILPIISNNAIAGTWSPALNNTTTTTYTFTPDAGQCATSTNLTMEVKSLPYLAAIPSQTVCAGQNVNGINFFANPGSTINWTNSEPGIGLAANGTGDIASFTGTNSGSSPLTAIITATPTANGCDGSPQTFSITILNNQGLPEFNQVSPVCYGQAINPLPATSNNNITGSWFPSFNNTSTLTYTFTPDPQFCVFTNTMTITVQPIATANISTANASCGNPNGIIAIQGVTGSTAPYLYSLNGGTFSTTTNYTGLAAANYTVNVKDANNCVYSQNVTLTSTYGPTGISTSIANPDCSRPNGVIAIFNVVGGTPPYLYSFNGNNFSTTSLYMNLSIGNYTIQVKDANNCIYSTLVSLVEQYPMTVNVSTVNTDCGASTGSAIAIVSGGTPPYIYQWSSGSQQAQTNNLAAGQYMVQVYDANRCNVSALVNIVAGNGPVANLASIQHVTCNGSQDGSLNVNITGGVPPYTLNWNSGQTTAQLVNIPAGYYDLTIRDASNCEIIQSFEILQPAPFEFNFTQQKPPCGANSGSLSTQLTGGTPPYTYQWSANANNQITANALNLTAGIYTLTVIDANNCMRDEITSLGNSNNNVQIQTDNVQLATCGITSTGAISITPTGGVAPYSFLWSNGSTNEDITNLSPGGYFVNITDFTGCQAYAYVYVQSSIANYQPEICIVTVDSALSRNKIVWEKTVQQGIKSFKIYREISTNNYQAIAEIPFSEESIYTDVQANPEVRSWRYKISAVDSCDIESPLSQKHKTIHLVQVPALGGNNSLTWDFYDGYSYDYFYIWRDDPSTGWLKIDSMPSNLTSYTDIAPPSLDSRYMIEIVPPSPCVSTMRNPNGSNELLTTIVKSKSNIRNNRLIGIKNYTTTKAELKLYPNPALDQLNIEIVNTNEKVFLVNLENMLGQLLYQNKQQQNKVSINTSNFLPGVYLVKVLTENGLIVKSVIVER